MPLSQDDPNLDYPGSWADASAKWPAVRFANEDLARQAHVIAWRDVKIPYGSYVLVERDLRLETQEQLDAVLAACKHLLSDGEWVDSVLMINETAVAGDVASIVVEPLEGRFRPRGIEIKNADRFVVREISVGGLNRNKRPVPAELFNMLVEYGVAIDLGECPEGAYIVLTLEKSGGGNAVFSGRLLGKWLKKPT